MKRIKTRYNPRSSFSARRSENKDKKRLVITLFIGIFFVYSLLTWILPTLIGGLSVVNKFKDVPKSQSSVAENPTLAPPVLNIPFEATNTATIKVKGYALSNTKVEIYVDDELQSTNTSSSDGSFTSDDISLNIGTNNISGKTVDEKGSKSLSSKPIKIIYSNEKPTLEITSPEDNKIIQGGDKKLTVSGKTNQGESITVTINDKIVIVSSDGNFSTTLNLNDGDNNITIMATNQAGNSAQLTRKVTYQPS